MINQPAVNTLNMDEETAAQVRSTIRSGAGDWETGWSITVLRRDDGKFIIKRCAPSDGNPRGVSGSQAWWKRLQRAGFEMEPVVHLGDASVVHHRSRQDPRELNLQ